jgi:hypothetical protein
LYDQSVGGIGFFATRPAPWNTLSRIAFLLTAMLSAWRTSFESNGFFSTLNAM